MAIIFPPRNHFSKDRKNDRGDTYAAFCNDSSFFVFSSKNETYGIRSFTIRKFKLSDKLLTATEDVNFPKGMKVTEMIKYIDHQKMVVIYKSQDKAFTSLNYVVMSEGQTKTISNTMGNGNTSIEFYSNPKGSFTSILYRFTDDFLIKLFTFNAETCELEKINMKVLDLNLVNDAKGWMEN